MCFIFNNLSIYFSLGWNIIAETIRALVKPDRIAKQLVPITKLAKKFLRFHCFDGAKTVGDCISSLFAEMDSSLAWQSKCCDVEAVVDMLVALEFNPETSSRKRVKSFALFFSKLRPKKLLTRKTERRSQVASRTRRFSRTER